jgi:hypothetical protein
MGKQYSMESVKTLDHIEELKHTYESMKHEADQISKSTDLESFQSVSRSKSRLAQLLGNIEKLQFNKLDAITTMHLHSGKSVAKSNRRELNAALDALQELVSSLYAKYDAASPPSPTSTSSSVSTMSSDESEDIDSDNDNESFFSCNDSEEDKSASESGSEGESDNENDNENKDDAHDDDDNVDDVMDESDCSNSDAEDVDEESEAQRHFLAMKQNEQRQLETRKLQQRLEAERYHKLRQQQKEHERREQERLYALRQQQYLQQQRRLYAQQQRQQQYQQQYYGRRYPRSLEERLFGSFF